jgi:signal transduction histidine kinase
MSARIGTQIVVLVVGALVLAHVAMTVAFLARDPVRFGQNSPFGIIERLVLVARMLDAEPDPGRRAMLLAQAQRADDGLSVLRNTPPPEAVGPEVRMLQHVQAGLGPRPELFLARPDNPQNHASSVVARLSDGTLLAAALPPPQRNVFMAPVTIGTLAFLASAVIILSWWAARQLTAPLVKFADAAEQFTTDAARPAIPEQGPLEVRRAAKALNDMQARLAKLIAARTRMLAAVSHDLRTPITRLRLRAEDIANEDLRAQILRDLGTMQNLVQSALSFLSGQHEPGPAIKTDLPPLVQTVCDGFSDMGHNVHYGGVAHLYVNCEPDQLMRAVENLIDNGLKFGNAVEVGVEHRDRAAVIDIQDNGPGITAMEKPRVIEPFYRGDTARNLGEGDSFGLGLSIAHAIVERSGGKLDLMDGTPTGLLARVTLPALADH